MSVLQYLLHLWAIPPVGLALNCPPPPAGVTANPIGSFDDASVRAAFGNVGFWSIAAIVATVAFCYMATRQSSGPRFDRRWLWTWIISGCVTGVLAYAILRTAGTTAMAQSCESDPTAFPHALPGSVVLGRALAGVVWGLLAFPFFSVVFARGLGWLPSLKNGFYHNRGTPWPRLLPWGK